MEYRAQLEKMRENFEQARPATMRLHRPAWTLLDDEVSKLYTDKEILIREGRVYYAVWVQANTHLFHSFPPFDYPAQLVYSTDQRVMEEPWLLSEAAGEIARYKYGGEPPEVLEELVDSVRDERDRSIFRFKYTVQEQELRMTMQTVMVFRKHLPTRKLHGSLLPILARPHRCDSVMILPKQYWTREFTEEWLTE